ncbi:hypothetical protein [Aquimarina sp. 2201CG5-10]|uniref:hypothetical protein n=1 Tax=Aquimarina callyspongiae TaxID=3098150 RepID=UPI002AB4C67E|nr:hypothetical protein [Aquimarina sp. 2201CG5-10]MDY8137555.1 hypothetical protein [Aquimarina sp. 2201CG5-10]
MDNEIIIIDKTEVQPISASRGQVLKFDLLSNTIPYNDDCKMIWSYNKTKKSKFLEQTLGNGIVRKEDNSLYMELDISAIRESFDIVYGEFFGYGTGQRQIVLNVGLNDSAY